MTDDAGRAQRKQVELLQGRMKEAHADLALRHSEGYLAQLEDLTDEARVAEASASARESEVEVTAGQLARARHDVAEAERRRLAPRAVYDVSPVVALLAFVGLAGACVVVADLVSGPLTPGAQAALAAMVVLPPPVLAWVARRRFSGASSAR